MKILPAPWPGCRAALALSTLLAGSWLVPAVAQVPSQVPSPATDSGKLQGLPAPMTDSSSGAIINAVPPTRRIDDPVPVPPVNRAPPPVVPPVVVNPAAGVVRNAPGSTAGPVLRPEIGRSSLDGLRTTPQPNSARNPANTTPGALSPADAAQRQLMIEREDRMRGLNQRQP